MQTQYGDTLVNAKAVQSVKQRRIAGLLPVRDQSVITFSNGRKLKVYASRETVRDKLPAALAPKQARRPKEGIDYHHTFDTREYV